MDWNFKLQDLGRHFKAMNNMQDFVICYSITSPTLLLLLMYPDTLHNFTHLEIVSTVLQYSLYTSIVLIIHIQLKDLAQIIQSNKLPR